MSTHQDAGSKKRSAGEKTQHAVIVISGLLIVGIITVSVLLARSVSPADDKSGAAVGITALLLFFAAGAAGSGLGFLFGLPRSRFVDQTNTSAPDSSPMRSSRASTFLVNSNLIKVSDWLTTIVIGLGLVNLAKLSPAVRSLQRNLVDPLGGTETAGVTGVSIIVIALLAGMLLTFLWTTIRVRELFEQSELDIAGNGTTLVEAVHHESTDRARLVVDDAEDESVNPDPTPPGTPKSSTRTRMISTKTLEEQSRRSKNNRSEAH